MTLVVVFQELFGYHVEGFCDGASELARWPPASLFHKEFRPEIEQQRGGHVAALLVDIRGIERLGIYRRTAGYVARGANGKVRPGAWGDRRCCRGVGLGPGRRAFAAAESLVGGGQRAGRDNGCWRDGQQAAVVELEYQPIGQDGQN